MSANGFSLYDRYVPLPTTDEEWQSKVRVFLENCEFPCVGAWDGFHVYINNQLKNYFSFKKRCSMMNLGLIGYNKRFLYAAVGAPGSTHDARLLKESSIYSDIINGNVIPERVVQLGDFGEIPLVTNTSIYIVMACITLYNLYIEISDPSQPRWRLEVDDLVILFEKDCVGQKIRENLV